jgi:hypothetical protein
MTVSELLQKVHVRYEKNTDYPQVGSEDHTVRLAYLDDSIDEWEKEAKEGVQWEELISEATITDDNLPTDFLGFLRAGEDYAVIKAGSVSWTECSPVDGNRALQENSNNYFFWAENGKLKSVPTISGTLTFPYLRKATRFPLGSEATAIDMKNPKFMQEYILGMLYLDDGNINQYNSHMNVASDILDTARAEGLIKTIKDKFPIGL